MESLNTQKRCKRPCQCPGAADDGQRSTKQQPTTFSDNYPAHVWNQLSKITLTRKALQEFDSRTAVETFTAASEANGTKRCLLRSDTRRLTQYAKGGGPNLSKLRGYADRPETKAVIRRRRQGRNKPSLSSTRLATTAIGMTTAGGPHDKEFEQILSDTGVYPAGHRGENGSQPPRPENLEDLHRRLALPRPSLSPSVLSEQAFEEFREHNWFVARGPAVTKNVIPTILGSHDKCHHFRLNKPFTDMEKFHPDLNSPQPGKYYGAAPSQIDPRVRDDLSPYIMPSSNIPAAPNHFLDFRAWSGRDDVLQRQAMYDAAVGARAMWHLQNYGQATPSYDGNAYSIVSTYSPDTGTLRMYATHPRESATGHPEYHMTQLGSYAMTLSRDNFRQGAAAVRNARDLSKDHRDQFIAAANITARNLPAVASSSSAVASKTSVGGGH